MLASDVEFIDIDPFQWGRLKEITALTGNQYKTAYILYNGEKMENIFIENSPTHSDGLEDDYNPVLQPHEIASKIFLKHPEVNRVETYELTALQSYGKKVCFNSDEMDSDVYFRYCRRLKSQIPGLNTFLRNPVIPQLDILDFLSFLERNNPQNYSLGIGLYRNNSLYFSLILGIEDGKIKLVSTFEYLHKFGVTTPSFDAHSIFIPKFLKTLQRDGEVIFLQLDLLTDLSLGSNKKSILQKAIHDEKARLNQGRFGLFQKFFEGCSIPETSVMSAD